MERDTPDARSNAQPENGGAGLTPIQLNYQNRVNAARTGQSSRWGVYFGGAVCALVSGYLIWIVLLRIWPAGHWQILQPEDMFGCDVLGSVVMMAISAGIYQFAASPLQAGRRHFMHGILAGLWLLIASNMMNRFDQSSHVTQGLVAIFYGSMIAMPIALGLLSRHEARKLNRPVR